MNAQDFKRQITIHGKQYNIYDISLLEKQGVANIKRLPFSIKILVENILRKFDGSIVTQNHFLNIIKWAKQYNDPIEIPFYPSRVLMQDFTGVPAVVDLVAIRNAFTDLKGDPKGDPKVVNPIIPVELVIDHSVQIDYYGTSDCLSKNVQKEYARNIERYQLLKWAQKNFKNLKVVPPNSGICHQVNLEYLGNVITTQEKNGMLVAFPDTVLGTDSHTPMINGIGVMGWGVGGIEAEAVMLGQPYYISIPEVIGIKLKGKLNEGVTATDLVLTITELLRKKNVVEKFIEYFGPGIKNLTIPDRATISNMTPETGATISLFPIDEKTIDYLQLTNRKESAELAKIYLKETGLFYDENNEPEYTEVIEFDLSLAQPSIAGPTRPHERIVLKDVPSVFDNIIKDQKSDAVYEVNLYGKKAGIRNGDIVIASITSCTNTSNPDVLLGAGLLAKNAVKAGLKVPSYVKTSLAPGSKVVIDYLKYANLLPYLEALGFHCAGFGCTTCIGNSGPLHPEIEKVIKDKQLIVASVLSGNRNFEARIHQNIKANFLMSPMLVIAYAIAGNINIDITKEPLSYDPNGNPVFLSQLWPLKSEIESLVPDDVMQNFFIKEYEHIFKGDSFWQDLPTKEGVTFEWDEKSTYIKRPPYFDNFDINLIKPNDINNARSLLVLGDSVTTDHISPAGAIHEHYPAGQYLKSEGVSPSDFNSYGSRRGNHDVMKRGTFGNIRIKNRLVGSKEGSFTIKFPEKKETFIYDAADQYQKADIPLIIFGGKEYGTGSSRDWAAKGTSLLGIKAIIAESYERIHRSNLVGMGVLPLVFQNGENFQSLGLDGSESFFLTGIENIKPRKSIQVKALKENKDEINFQVIARLDTEVDVIYFENRGILPYILRKFLSN